MPKCGRCSARASRRAPELWEFLASTNVGPAALRDLVQFVFQTYAGQNVPLDSPAGARLRGAALPQLDGAWLEGILRNNVELRNRLSPEGLLAVLEDRARLGARGFPARRAARTVGGHQRGTGGLAGGCGDARLVLARSLWDVLRDEKAEGAARTITSRNEAVVARPFEQIEPASFADFLKTDDAAHEPWLMRWLRAHKPERGDEILLLAATHTLPGVRAWGLGRAKYLPVSTWRRRCASSSRSCPNAWRRAASF